MQIKNNNKIVHLKIVLSILINLNLYYIHYIIFFIIFATKNPDKSQGYLAPNPERL